MNSFVIPNRIGNHVFTEVLMCTFPNSTVPIYIRVKKGYDCIVPVLGFKWWQLQKEGQTDRDLNAPTKSWVKMMTLETKAICRRM